MESLNDHFIFAPLSTLLTFLTGISFAIVFNDLGKRIFRNESPIFRAMYFLAGLLALSWITWLICLANLATSFTFHLLLLLIFTYAGYLLTSRKYNLSGNFQRTFDRYTQPSLSSGHKYFRVVIISVVTGYILLSLTVPTDADSLNYHLALPVEILQKGSLWFNKDNLHFRMAGFGEMLNLIGVANGCPQLGAFVQILAFLHVLYALASIVKPDMRSATVTFILSMPTLLFLIPSQKNQLTGMMATTLCFFSLHRFKSFEKSELILWVSVLLFAMGIKYSFFLSGGVLLAVFLLKNVRNSEKPAQQILIIFALTIAILGPQILFRWYYFGDPLSPLLEQLKAPSDPVIIQLHSYIKNYYESRLPFPLNLLITTSAGRISTILGVPTLILFCLPFLYRNYKFEIIPILLLILFIFMGGQPTSRFLMEPILWSIPILIKSYQTSKWFKYAVLAAKFQLVLMLPLILFGLYNLAPSLLSDSQRDRVLAASANGYSEAKWLNEVLPKDAKIAVANRSRAFLPRPYLPWEYLIFTSLKDENQALELDKKFTEYGINYLVLPLHGMEEVKARYTSGIAYGPKRLAIARRNNFDFGEYAIAVYRIKK